MTHSFSNDQIARIFRNVSVAYLLKNESKYRFQSIAYQKASDTIAASPTQALDLYKSNRLDALPGIGASMRASLEELFTTGKVKHLEAILEGVPQAIYPLLDITGFGPKKAHKLVVHFKLDNPNTVVEDLLRLAKEHKIAELEGFGEKSEQDIVQGIEEFKKGATKTNRMVLPYASEIAKRMVEYLKSSKAIIEVSTLGSLRRQKSTIGDVDIAVTTKDPKAVLDYFVAYPDKERIIERGDVTSSILLTGGKQVDLMVLAPESWGSLLQHFTGSKEHNIALREYALKKGYSLSERGIKLKENGKEKMVTFTSEEKFYNFLGLDWMPPEIREDNGEIQLAIKHNLPTLVEQKDITGDLHIHSNYEIISSHDYGTGSMQEMIDKAIALGYQYVGISDHNPRVNNLSKDNLYKLLNKRKQYIDNLKKSNKSIRVINMLELDILASGELAIDDKALEYVDAVLVSIHSSFGMEKEAMTKRILKGFAHPKAKIFSHPTGRLLNKRVGYTADWDQIYTFAAEHDKALEINAWPERLDLPDAMIKQAKEIGVKFVIDTDAHAVDQMDNMPYGVSVARRGWCEKKDILNTLPAEKFIAWITK